MNKDLQQIQIFSYKLFIKYSFPYFGKQCLFAVKKVRNIVQILKP